MTLHPHRPPRFPAPHRAAGVLLVALLVLSGCDVLSGGESPEPSSSERPAATPRPTPLPTPPPGAVILSVEDRQYSTDIINGVANVPTIVYFTNHDDTNHNLTIYRNAAKDLELFRGDIFSGPDVTIVYEIPALAAGDYYFSDYTYPSMHGTFVVR